MAQSKGNLPKMHFAEGLAVAEGEFPLVLLRAVEDYVIITPAPAAPDY